MIDYYATKSQPITKICSLFIGASVKDKVLSLVIINTKSRMKGDFHVRFRGNAGVKFPCMTLLAEIL